MNKFDSNLPPGTRVILFVHRIQAYLGRLEVALAELTDKTQEREGHPKERVARRFPRFSIHLHCS